MLTATVVLYLYNTTVENFNNFLKFL